MTRFIRANLARGELSGARILPDAAYDELFRPALPTERSDGSEVALGWFVREHRGRVVLGHGGWDPGFRAGLSLVPEEGCGVVVFANFHFAAVYELVNAALDVLLGVDPEPIFAPLSELRAHAGRFRDAEGSELALEPGDDALFLVRDSQRVRMTPASRHQSVAPLGDRFAVFDHADTVELIAPPPRSDAPVVYRRFA